MAETSNLGPLSREDYVTVGTIRKHSTISDFAKDSDGFSKNPSARTPRTLENGLSSMDAVTKGPEQEEFPALSRVDLKSLEKVDMTNAKSRTFADRARGSAPRFQDVFVTTIQALQPVNKGEFYEIFIPENLYQEQLQKFNFSLIGRLLLNKGTSPIPIHDLKKIIQEKMGLNDPWNLVSLGKAHFTLQLSSARDQNRARSNGYWVLAGGVLKIRDWVPDFNPFKVQTTVAPIWVRIYNLPFEYWHTSIITGISKALGNPLKMDGNTASGIFGSFARVLVEIDLTHGLQESVVIARGNVSFSVDFEYENAPPFCGACQHIGHLTANCRRYASGDARPKGKDNLEQNKNLGKVVEKNVWVSKQNSQPTGNNGVLVASLPSGSTKIDVAGNSGVATQNTFQLLSEDEEGNEGPYIHKPKMKEQTFNKQTVDVQNFVNEDQLSILKTFEHNDETLTEAFINEKKLKALLGDSPTQVGDEATRDNLSGLFNKHLVGEQSGRQQIMIIEQENVADDPLEYSGGDRAELDSGQKVVKVDDMETPFVTKRRGRGRPRKVLADVKTSSLHKDIGVELDPSDIARHNMSSIARGDLRGIIDAETGRSPEQIETEDPFPSLSPSNVQ